MRSNSKSTTKGVIEFQIRDGSNIRDNDND